MSVRFKKSYKFALKSALFITVFSFLILMILLVLFFEVNLLMCFIFGLAVYVFSFFVIQYRVEHFVYRRIKKIYDNVSILDSSVLRSKAITTDMETLTNEVQKFATYKKIEIESLKVREEYRREFLGNISHELKTPLFTVQSYLSTLLDGAIDDKTVRKKYVERAEKGVERLIYIVKDLDMITKLETGDLHLNYSEFDIVKAVETVFELLEMRAEQKEISLIFDMNYVNPIMVYADEDRIVQLISNLVENSIKYGKVKGTTEVSIEDLVNNKIIVRVTDNGDGIKEKYVPRLFERFFRIDKSGARSVGGSGLGLSIVKHIVEAHEEHIYLESKYGYGSEFSFTLERAK
ncbi:cell wall metabolism sensor histidine kinase WalK [Flavobacterium sp. HSC-61S13]|uniref:sensor histidine kinase n=1 Tax=Flavobacterium sp. HSC-61S13 TaxID=2910963 RepID=UPI00209EF937|nr:ATP-binding protein [Flavobacterium sp. HSC-61S13]MCP1995330.1 two-component system phosphate regulon sensor histidine kinase PhoR [Flavobacterium sp. HSC-61S13]